MLKVTTMDGQEFYGADEKEIVRQMRNSTWGKPEPKGEYMKGAASRASGMTGIMVEGKRGAVKFLKSLEKAGLIQIKESKEM